MAEIVYRDGQAFISIPNADDIPLSEEEARQAQMGVGGAAVGAFGDYVRDAAGGFAEQLTSNPILNPTGAIMEYFGVNPASDAAQRFQQANDARQAARAEFNEAGAIAGTTAGVGLELAIPGGPAATSARRGSRVAREVIDSIPSGTQRAADDSLSAARTGPDAPAYQGERSLVGMNTVEELTDAGIPLTRGDIAALNARNADELGRAQAIRQREGLAVSAELGSLDNIMDVTTGIARTRNVQEDALTQRLAAELGDPNVTNLTRGARQRIRSEVQDVFRKHIDEGTGDIPGVQAAEDAQKIASLATGNAQQFAQRTADEIVSKVKNGAIDRKAFSSVRKDIGDDMRRAFDQGNYELGSTLSQMQEVLDDALYKTLDGDAISEVQEARRRWRMLKALEARRATDPAGQLNPTSFQAAYERVTPSFRRASRESDDFEKFMDTIQFLTARQTGESGTAPRILNALRQSRLPTLAAGGAALGNSIFGQ